MNRRVLLNACIPITIIVILPILTVGMLILSTQVGLLAFIIYMTGLFAFGVLLVRFYSSDGDNMPKFYRYEPRKRLCPHCKYPYASVRNQTCVYCGGSLVVQNSQ